MVIAGGTGKNLRAADLDARKLRAVVYQLSWEHVQLLPALLRVGAAGSALAANPGSSACRHEAHDAWQAMLRIVDQHMGAGEDEDVLEGAEELKLVPDAAAEVMLGVCERLK